MKFYKDPNTSEVYAYEADGSQDDLIREGWMPLDDGELLTVRAEQERARNPNTPERFAAAVGRAVDAMLDALARSWRYRDYVSARSYAVDAQPKYAAEGSAIAAYGSACYSILDALESDVRAGRKEMPQTVEQVLAILPAPPSRPQGLPGA